MGPISWHSGCSISSRNHKDVPVGGIKMKKLVFGLYVATVLLFSGLARAEADLILPISNGQQPQMINPIIREVLPATNVLALQISGLLPNPMTDEPSARLVQDQDDPRVLILTLSTKKYDGISVSPVSHFNVVVSLPQLAYDAGIQPEEKAIYILKIKGHDFHMQFSGADLMTFFPLPVTQTPATI